MVRTQILVHTSWGPQQGFQHCFADGLNQGLVLLMARLPNCFLHKISVTSQCVILTKKVF